MSLADIQASFYDALALVPGLPPIYHRNVDDSGEPQPPAGAHIVPFVIPNKTRTIGLTSLGQRQGLLQVNVRQPLGAGELEGARVAELILAAFPRQTELTGCRIDSKGYIGPQYEADNFHITPVTIPYQQLED